MNYDVKRFKIHTLFMPMKYQWVYVQSSVMGVF